MLGLHIVARILRQERQLLVGVPVDWFILGTGGSLADIHTLPLDRLWRIRRVDLRSHCIK